MTDCPQCEHHKETARMWRQKAHKEWVGLTEDEIIGHTCECVDDGTFNMKCAIDFARFIEAKLKEKNNG